MSANRRLQAAMAAALRAHPPLAGGVTAILDAPPVRALHPFVVVDDPVLTDWSTKDQTGREGRIALFVRDTGERPERLRELIGEAEAAIEAMPAEIGEGWRIVGRLLMRSRVLREGAARWAAISEWRVRMLRSM